MCGIAGVVGSVEVDSARALVGEINAAQARRGPDAEGLTVQGPVAFGHRRLSIYDLSDDGRQPMASQDGSALISFNGSIYNFLELRGELESEGVVFRSRTDTEVLVEGYLRWGLDRLIERCRGMYAFGLWDSRQRRLFLVRDRLGVKPLLFVRRGHTLAFASSAAALHRAGLAGDLDPEAVEEFLDFGFVPDRRSIYQGIEKIPAGGLVEWRELPDGDWELIHRRYWTPPVEPSSEPIDFEEAVEEAGRLLDQAVRRRAFADVPLAALLSGGIDSALICQSIAAAGLDIRAFTVAVPGDPWDESDDARKTAAEIGIPLEVLDASAADFPDVDELNAAYGEPFACSSALGMLRLSKLIKPVATALLTGDGGDDVFLGYPEHRNFWAAQRLAQRTPRPLAAALRATAALLPARGTAKRAGSFLNYATGGLGAAQRVREGISRFQTEGLLGERLKDLTTDRRYDSPSLSSARRLLPEFLEYDHQTRFTGEYLTKVDGATMYYALEARSPFLDQDLWEFAARLPFQVRLHRGVPKAILRELARRRISERVATGRKRGFGIPAGRWLVSRWRTQAEDAFRDSILESDGWIAGDRVRALLQRSIALGQAPNRLWYLFVLENWRRRMVGEARPTAAIGLAGF